MESILFSSWSQTLSQFRLSFSIQRSDGDTQSGAGSHPPRCHHSQSSKLIYLPSMGWVRAYFSYLICHWSFPFPSIPRLLTTTVPWEWNRACSTQYSISSGAARMSGPKHKHYHRRWTSNITMQTSKGHLLLCIAQVRRYGLLQKIFPSGPSLGS